MPEFFRLQPSHQPLQRIYSVLAPSVSIVLLRLWRKTWEKLGGARKMGKGGVGWGGGECCVCGLLWLSCACPCSASSGLSPELSQLQNALFAVLQVSGTWQRPASCVMPARDEMRSGGFELVQKGLRKRNSPMCTLSQNGYGDCLCRPSAIALSRSRRKAQAKKKPQERHRNGEGARQKGVGLQPTGRW
jgi:hypothetical protein